MSYFFGTPELCLEADLGTSGLSYPFTLGAWVYFDTHPAANYQILQFGTSNASINDSLYITTHTTSQAFRGYSITSGGNTNSVTSSANGSNGAWYAVVAIFGSDTDRRIYVAAPANSATDETSSNAVTVGSLRYISVGANLVATSNLPGDSTTGGRIAEVAIWNSDLSLTADDLADYMDGSRPASAIDASNLLCYSTLDPNGANAGLSDSSGAGAGTLTATEGTASNNDSTNHPTISSGATKYLKLLTKASGEDVAGPYADIHMTWAPE